jgi:hypothetical protein
MINTFVKLPNGDVGIDHIREMYEDLKGSDFQYMDWKPRPALVERNRGTSWLYIGQKFDSKYIDLVQDGWTHDHCQICAVTINENKNEHTVTVGYFDGYDWVCKSCYENILAVDNLKKKLNELPQYQK